MNNDYLSKLNNQQKLAVTSDLGSTLVVAGAGSGKTAVLVYRIVHLVKEIGFDPKRILAFTFTNKAANEMKRRIYDIVNNSSFNWIGTFHSICLKILREDISHLGRKNDFIIIDEDDQLSVVREMYAKLGFDKNKLSYSFCLNAIRQLKTNRIDVNNSINECRMLVENDPNDSKANIIKDIYKEYQEYLIANNYFDFDDLIFYTLKLFEQNLDVLSKWQNRFDYILVDEFQDTNIEQYDLIKLLSKEKTNIFVVGDPDQMIYSWRGAYKDIFNDFQNEFNNVSTIILDKNYRSSKNILEISNDLIKKNSNRIRKELYTDNEVGNNIIYYNASTQDRESNWVVNKIKLLLHNDKYKYSDIAILYRSNFVSRNIEQELIRSNIPYFIFGGFKFYQRKEIKDMIAYLKLICNNDDISLSRIYNIPKRKISEGTITKVKEYAYNNRMSIFEAFDHLEKIDIKKPAIDACVEFKNLINQFKEKKFKSLTDLYEYVLEETGYKSMLIEQDEKNRLENLEELKNAINQFEFKNPGSTIVEYLQEISLFTSLDEQNADISNSITLMTVHLAKGLEFKNVFIIEFNEGIFPSQKSVDDNNIDEERRIAYVAMTRAKENLFITSSNGMSFLKDSKYVKTPSRFINEIKKNPKLEIVSESFVSLSKREENNEDWFNSQVKEDYSKYFHDENQEFNIGDTVIHSTFGSGVIIGIKNDILDITFKHPYGNKSIMKNHKSLVRKLS